MEGPLSLAIAIPARFSKEGKSDPAIPALALLSRPPSWKAVLDNTRINPADIGDIVVGTMLGPSSQRANECRMAALFAGFPETIPVKTVNRQCSSGLQAVADVAAAIKAGYYDIGLVLISAFQKAHDCLLPMGITSKNVAHRYGVTRQEQDQAAAESHRRAGAATASRKFKDEIVPMPTKIVDPKTGEEKEVVILVDDGIRPSTYLLYFF
ncbi:3-ketoacyl-CoA thiolase 1, peroxisomal [Zea mays]|uniref:3-ketoacyl-CoA thiolase 1, peroxisomal n=1 Tax=Zea mays TaxID=4577 RepID=A0A3L6FNV4_MAIZE|nr:3-ketoacyl-CoA thiolase 1, peroxisomal [Zea mays]